MFKKILIFLLIFLFNNSYVNASGAESLLIGILEGLNKQAEEKNKEKKIKKESGLNQEEFEIVKTRFVKFAKCAKNLENDINYIPIQLKSPRNLSYSDFRINEYISQKEEDSLTWYVNKFEVCYNSSKFENIKVNSYVAYEFYRTVSAAYIRNIILLARLHDRQIDWGEYNIGLFELNENVEDQLNDIDKQFKKNISDTISSIKLEEHQEYIKRQSKALSNAINKIQRLEYENAHLENCARSPYSYSRCPN